MAEIVQSTEKIYVPSSASFIDAYAQDGGFKLYIKMLSLYSVIASSIIFFLGTTTTALYYANFLAVFGIVNIVIAVFYMFISESGTSSKLIVPNKKNEDFMLNLGREVRKHLGNAVKSSILSNLTGKYLLFHAETIKRMGAVIGTTGSGKTVLLKGMMEQMLLMGVGCFTTDAKGTIDELKKTFALWYSTGAEKLSYVLNFANMNNTHSIDILSTGSALMLKETLGYLVENDDPKWKGVSMNFIENLLKLLVYKRDIEGLVLKPSVLTEYFSLQRLLDEAWNYKKNDDIFIQDFIKYVTTALGIDYTKFKKDSSTTFKKECDKAVNGDSQGVYEVTVATNDWISNITLLGSNYGKILNSESPDLELFETIQNNKNIWVVLPTMESEDAAKKIGRIFLGLIKAAADKKIKKSFEPKLPYLFLLDEFGSIVVEGFGRFMSKSRALGMSMWIFFQSLSQLKVVGEEEMNEIMEMCNTIVAMKMKDKNFAEEAAAFLEDVYELRREHSEEKRLFDGEKGSSEYSYRVEKEETPIKPKDFIDMNLGEMICFTGSEHYKSIGCITSDLSLTYQEKNIDVIFPLHQSYPKKKLLKELSTVKRRVFRNIINQEVA